MHLDEFKNDIDVEKIELLKDHTHFTANGIKLFCFKCAHFPAVESDGTAGRCLQAINTAHEGTLTCTGQSDYAKYFTN